MSEQINCPYCNTLLSDDSDPEFFDECEHLVSVQDDFVEWVEYDVICNISSFFEESIIEDPIGDNPSLLDGLKIKDSVLKTVFDADSKYDGTMEVLLESLSEEICFKSQSWDGGAPGLSGVMQYFFIKNKKTVQWIFDEFEVFYNRLVEWEKNKLSSTKDSKELDKINSKIASSENDDSIIDYFENGGYLRDLKKIESNRTSSDKSSISIVQLFEYNNDIPNLVNNVENDPTSFLFSYFFITLIKQSIHANNIEIGHSKLLHKSKKKIIELIDNTPLFKGLLGTAHSNLHPALILMIATLYKEDNQDFLEDFKKLNDHFFYTIFNIISINEENVLDNIFNSFAVLFSHAVIKTLSPIKVKS